MLNKLNTKLNRSFFYLVSVIMMLSFTTINTVNAQCDNLTVVCFDVVPPVVPCAASLPDLPAGDDVLPAFLALGGTTSPAACNVTAVAVDVDVEGACAEEITRTRTYTISNTDMPDQSFDCVVVYTSIDDIAPVLAGVGADATVECPEVAVFPDPTATDNCDPAPVITFVDVTIPVCAGDMITRTWTATDACGNESTATQTITQVDTTPPTLTDPAPDAVVVCPAPVVFVAPTASDDCDAAPVVTFVDTVEPDCAGDGVTRTWTATDACGNTATAAQTIMILDDVPPVLAGVGVDADVPCPDPLVFPDVTATDDCDMAPVVTFVDLVVPSCAGDGMTRTWTATDACGNTATDAMTLTYIDVIPPVIEGVVAAGTYVCGEAPAWSEPTVMDECTATPTLVFVDLVTGTNCAGDIIERTWTATDGCGNTATDVQLMTPDDTEPAVISGVGPDGTFECGGTPVFSAPVATDCMLDELTFVDVEGAPNCTTMAPVTRTWTAVDLCGNEVMAEQTMTPEDTRAPEVYCQHQTIAFTDDACMMPIDWVDPTATDECDAALAAPVQTVGPAKGTPVAPGVYEICYEATDACMNVGECCFNVTVKEYAPNGLVCRNINVSLDQACMAKLTPDQLLANPELGCVDHYEIEVWDPHGNSIGCLMDDSFLGEKLTYMVCLPVCGLCCWGEIIVEDKFPPQIACMDTIVSQCSGYEHLPPPNAIENCSNATVLLVDEQIEALPCNDDYTQKVTRRYIAIDGSGTESVDTCTQVIMLERVTISEVEIPENITLYCGANYVTNAAGWPDPTIAGMPQYCEESEYLFLDSGLTLGAGDNRSLELADVDGDGDLDAFIAVFGASDEVYINDGMGGFTNSGQILNAGDSYGVTMGDVDGDGDIDAFVTVANGGSNIVYLNNGLGIFTDSGQLLGSFDSRYSVLCDLDGDGDLDAFVTNSTAQANQVYLNNGSGVFTNSGQNLGTSSSFDLDMADLDGDGDKDAFVTNMGANTVWFNDGSGVFTNSGQNIGTTDSREVQLCDLNGDGILDAFVTNSNGPSQVYYGQASGIFTDSGQALGGPGLSVEFIDLNCDGFKDAFVTTIGGPNVAFINDGVGIFTDSGLAIGGSDSWDVKFLDIDNDGDLDAYIVNSLSPDMLWLNNTQCGGCYNLYPDTPDVLCNTNVSYTDQVITITECKTKVMRTWTAQEWHCSGETTLGGVQFIEIIDTVGPVFMAPADVTISTKGGYECVGHYEFPAVSATDVCNTNISYNISYPGGLIENNGGHGEMEVGTHEVIYTVFDGCYNQTRDTMYVTVADQTEPVALCDQNTVVSIPHTGFVEVLATSFDDGSWDDCGLHAYEVRRMDTYCQPSDTLWGETVSFCCDDLALENIMVAFRVTDYGGYSNMCMVNVEVQDKVVPTLTCPEDMTINCTDVYDLNNLGLFFGFASTSGNCGATSPADSVEVNINQCGSGSITRYFKVEGTNDYPCWQTITIENNNLFDGDIDWPLDYESFDCDERSLEPADLPEGYDFPVYDEDECNLLGYNHTDELFEFNEAGTACLKIIRHWTVINWCDPADLGDFTKWTYDQEIKIYDTEAPEILGDCEDKIGDNAYCTFDAACAGLLLTLDNVAIDACVTDPTLLNWSYHLDIYNDGDTTNEFSGDTSIVTETFPIGTHKIYWTVNDNCGNVAACDYLFEIRSCKAPSPVCVHGLSVDLVPWIDIDPVTGAQDTSESATLWASDFDASSAQSCNQGILFSFSSDTSDTRLVLDCDDLGIVEVEMWVTDPLTGAQDFCRTTIDVQDNNDFDYCPTLSDTTLLGRIAGRVFTPENVLLDDVEVYLSGKGEYTSFTNQDGAYAFQDIELHFDYLVDPSKDIEHLNGVSTLDLVLIQRHVIGALNLDSPYKLIAADVNKDDNITALDLIELRKLILGIYSEFPNNESWRFLDDETQFIDPANPWGAPFNEVYSIANFSTNMLIDFIGVKVGDVNNSVILNATGPEVESRSNDQLELVTDDIELRAGQSYTIELELKEASKLVGMQATFKTNGVEIIDIQSSVFDSKEASFANIDEQFTTLSFHAINAQQMEANDELIILNLKANKNMMLSEALVFCSEITKSEAYNEQLEIMDVDLRFDQLAESFALYQNEPNPWREYTTISFNLGSNENVEFNFYNTDGKLLHTRNNYFNAGLNSIRVDANQLKTTGVIIYEVLIGNKRYNEKMILIK